MYSYESLPISFSVALLALVQSYVCPSTSEVTLIDMGKIEWYKTTMKPNTAWIMGIIHYSDIIMSAMAYKITSLAVVYSTVYSDADQRKHQSSASLAFVWGIHRDRWIPRTKGQWRGKCFHLMTSSCHETYCTFIAYRLTSFFMYSLFLSGLCYK